MTALLKKKAYLATLWVIGGYGTSQLLRLGGNLILTRLLVPELFGVMAIANVFIVGLALFSDIGLGPGIIRSKRSSDPTFYNTAWTLQTIRGGTLWLLTFVIAIPVARAYDSPVLAQIIPVTGLTLLLTSFTSTSVHTLNKRVLLGKTTALQLIAQFVGLLVMVLAGYYSKNIWSLVAGSIVSALVSTVGSHFLDPSSNNRFHLEKEAVRELISFGKWIFFSTAMMFLATQSDRLLLGKLMPLTLFGVYNIAVTFAELPKQVLLRVTGKVLFPLLTSIADLPRSEFRKKILLQRKKILIPLLLLVMLLAGFGDILITSLYDQRYHQAGWMLPLLALGMWPYILFVSINQSFYAIGKPKIPAIGNLCKFLYMAGCVPLLFHFAGVIGGVLAVALNDLPVYLVVSIGLEREGLSCLRQDLLFTLLLLAGLGLCLALRLSFGLGLPGLRLLGAL